ncbi:MAG TPA: hypothetical protein VHA70_10380 [Bauldia sp.]|nr:hypothetical protein [Bauldia sp.]
MKHLLARFGAGPGADHRAVFSGFARRLSRVIALKRAAPKVRAVAG